MWVLLKESYRIFHLSVFLRTHTVSRHQGSKHPVQPCASVRGLSGHCRMFAQTRQLYQQPWSPCTCEPWKQDSLEVISPPWNMMGVMQVLKHWYELSLKCHFTSWGRPCIWHPSPEVSSVHSPIGEPCLKAMRARITAAEWTNYLIFAEQGWKMKLRL